MTALRSTRGRLRRCGWALRFSVRSAPVNRRLVFCFSIVFAAATCAAAAQQPSKPRPAGRQTQTTRSRAPHPLQALLDRAEKALADEQFAVAIEALEKFVAEQPDDAYAHFHLGYARSALKQWPEAIAAYRRATELKPDMAAAHLNLGLILYEHESPEASVPPLRRAAELLANEARPHFLLGTALERSGKHAEAIVEYRAAAALDSRDADTQLALGRALLTTGKHAEAESAFRRALELDAQNAGPDAIGAGARLGLAQSLIEQKKLAQAAAELEAFLAAQPDNAEGWRQLAWLRAEAEDYDKALAALDRADALAQPPAAPTLLLRADIYQAQRRIDDAIATLATLLQQQPQDAALHARLGRLHLEKRDFPAAERELLAALRLDADSLNAMRDLASVYYLAEKYEAALAVMDRIEQRETPRAFSWFLRATCYDKLLRKADAVAAYEKFLELDAGRDESRGIQARARVRTLKRELENKR